MARGSRSSGTASRETVEQVRQRVLELLTGQQLDDNDQSPSHSSSSSSSQLQRGYGLRRLHYSEAMTRDATMTVLLPLLILLSTLLFLLVFFLVFLIVLKRKRRRSRIALTDNDGPLDLAREEELEGEGGLQGIEQRWLEQQDDPVKAGYERAKLWQQQYLPNSTPTDITLSQFLSIQEKGVSAWSFEPDYETNSPLFVTSRTEITFLEDGVGMAAQEGGACCVQSNLPLPRLNEVYYWECKLFEKPEATNIAIGLSTKPYPSFRMPGWNRYSIGYFSSDGFKCHNYPFAAQSYGPPLSEGDVLGVGYRPRTGAVFFTRNGKKLDDAYIGLTKHNLFPTVAADGAATIHVNLGQAGFVFIEANVKKWGLAPMIGTLAPPPAYGSDIGSILLETAGGPEQQHHAASANSAQASSTSNHQHVRNRSDEVAAVAALQPPQEADAGPSRSRLASHRRMHSNSTAPIRPSPLRTSMTRTRTSSYNGSNGSASSSPVSIPGTSSISPHNEVDEDGGSGEEDELLPHNPPTPGQLDISLRAMSPFSRRQELEDREERASASSSSRRRAGSSPSEIQRSSSSPPTSSTPPYQVSIAGSHLPARLPGDVSPPSYQLIDSNQYPAGVAEAMLETMPEDQFAALFSAVRNAASSSSSAARSPSSSSALAAAPAGSNSHSSGGRAHFTSGTSSSTRSYEGRSDGGGAQSGSNEASAAGQGLGLRGILDNVFRRGSASDA